ncbi:MAG: GxxExxY protein [Verrucomicrobiales bacterium]|jgi:GxxExxY protein|nr:GxxExxY protein [Verrucomicrobiales bacterium]
MEQLTGQIIAAAIEVHRALGPGLLESAYEECLGKELELQNIPFKRQVPLPIIYKGFEISCGYRLDLVVSDAIILELKTVSSIEPIHAAQLLTYLKLSHKTLGLIINFHVPVLKQGIKRIVNNHPKNLRVSAPPR